MLENLKRAGLVKAQRNDIFDGIAKQNMDHSDFVITDASSPRMITVLIFEKNHKKYNFRLLINKLKPDKFRLYMI